MLLTIGYFLGTHEDWGGASRALLNFVRSIDRQRFRPIVILTKSGALADQLDADRIDWLVWRTHDRGSNLARYAADIWRATRFFKEHALQILHINLGTIGWKPAEVLAAHLLRIPVINHLHVPFGRPSSFIRYSSAVVAVSRYVADHSESLGVAKHVIHNISDVDRFGSGVDLRRELGYAENDVIVAFLGQMIKVKGLELFVEIATRIADERAKFVVAGPLRRTEDAYTEAEVHELVARDPRIRYIGYRTDVENLYATADVVVMPSQWDEPCAMVLFEAAAAGKPVVATATGGTPEILRHGETGFLVDRHDAAGMSQFVAQLVGDRALRQRMGEAARYLARASLAVDPVRQIEDLYSALARK
ncbi:MAG TPA: glycosyltransferase family 4 protein [Casimicrobiaceae bacterium]|nr:glycosyltransferase family 4 protein [Casimicrobiaceae bacterium]